MEKDYKITGIGDIHGRDIWKEIINKEENSDEIVFVGDYFDSFDVLGDKQIQNFLDIIEYKKKNPKKVKLLIGNHDFHYFEYVNQQYSGYQKGYQYQIQAILKDNAQYLQMCHLNRNYLFTHAGVSRTWARNNDIDISLDKIEGSINDLFHYSPYCFNFTRGRFSSDYGDDICQTPIWIRPFSLQQDNIPGYIQIVGHTPKEFIMKMGPEICLIDVLENKEYLVIENGDLYIRQI